MKIFQHPKLILVVLLALILRLPHLTGSFWLDEAAQALESARPLSQQLQIIPDFQPPLLHLLLHLAFIGGSSEWWLRTVGALIPGIITVALVYDLGRRLFNSQVGFWAAVFLATSSFHIFYSQELRQYALPAALAVASWWCLFTWPTKLTQPWYKHSRWWAFTLISVAGFYTSYLYPFLWLAQLLYGWVVLKKFRPDMVLSAILAGLAFAPWLPMFKQQLDAGSLVRVELPGWSQVVSIPQLKSLPLVFLKFIFGVVDVEANIGFVLPLGLLLAMIGAVFWHTRKTVLTTKNRPVWLGLLIWLVLPLATSWIISFWIPVVQPKRVLYLLPAFYLLIAGLAYQSRIQWLKWGVLGLVVLINVVSTGAYYTQPRYQRENWRDLISQLETRYSADRSLAIFVFPESYAPWRWYGTGDIKSLALGKLHINQVSDLNQQMKAVTEYDYVITFDYLQDLSDPNRELLQTLEAYGFRNIEILDYPNIGFVRIYTRGSGNVGYDIETTSKPVTLLQ